MGVVRSVTVAIVGRSASPLYGPLVAGPWTVRHRKCGLLATVAIGTLPVDGGCDHIYIPADKSGEGPEPTGRGFPPPSDS